MVEVKKIKNSDGKTYTAVFINGKEILPSQVKSNETGL